MNLKQDYKGFKSNCTLNFQCNMYWELLSLLIVRKCQNCLLILDKLIFINFYLLWEVVEVLHLTSWIGLDGIC